MATKSYDLMLQLLPKVLLQQEHSDNLGLFLTKPLPRSLLSANSGPYYDLQETQLEVRFDGNATVVLDFEPVSNPASNFEIAAYINSIAGSTYAYAVDSRIELAGAFSVEIMHGNKVLGFYELHDMRALLKVIAPVLDDYTDRVKSFFDLVDVRTAPSEFAAQVGALVGYKWKLDQDTDTQRRVVEWMAHFYRYKGTIPAIEYLIRLKGGNASVFQPYPFIARYEEFMCDGERLFKNPKRRYYTGVLIRVINEFRFRLIDTTNTPFQPDDIYRYVFLPHHPGPISGFRIGSYVSPSEVVVYGKHNLVDDPPIGDEGDLTIPYEIIEKSATLYYLQDRTFWHEGVYEVRSDIAPYLYREDVLQLTHPTGRVVYFNYELGLSQVNVGIKSITQSVELNLERFIRRQSSCGLALDVGLPTAVTLYNTVAGPFLVAITEVLQFRTAGITWSVTVTGSGTPYTATAIANLINLAAIAAGLPSGTALGTSSQRLAISGLPYGNSVAYVEVVSGSIILGFLTGRIERAPSAPSNKRRYLEGPEAKFDGCPSTFTDVSLEIDAYGSGRRPLAWSQVLHWEDVSGHPVYFLPPYTSGSGQPVSQLLPDGHIWSDTYTDVEPSAHIQFNAYSTSITRGAGATDSFPPDIPSGSRILLVNRGGTPDHTTDTFTGGTNYTEYNTVGPVPGWTQTATEVDWSLAVSAPSTGQTYRVYYLFDPYALIS